MYLFFDNSPKNCFSRAYPCVFTDGVHKYSSLDHYLNTYNQKAVDLIDEGNFLKFSQNELLMKNLLLTAGVVFVEASFDEVWGIGMLERDYRSSEPERWIGKNIHGVSLINVRRRLRGW